MSNKEPPMAENRQARFYAIIAAGCRRLAADRKAWDRMVSGMHALFEDPA